MHWKRETQARLSKSRRSNYARNWKTACCAVSSRNWRTPAARAVAKCHLEALQVPRLFGYTSSRFQQWPTAVSILWRLSHPGRIRRTSTRSAILSVRFVINLHFNVIEFKKIHSETRAVRADLRAWSVRLTLSNYRPFVKIYDITFQCYLTFSIRLLISTKLSAGLVAENLTFFFRVTKSLALRLL